MVKLWRCDICGDAYVGDDPPPDCPFCGAHRPHIKPAKEAKVSFDIELNERDKSNAETALNLEVSNVKFYFCAAKKTNDEEGKLLFKALGKVEAEHASILKKLLKLTSLPQSEDDCVEDYMKNLKNAHERETRAINFYTKAASESEDSRLKQILEALIEVEKDHLQLHEDRLK